LTAGTSLPVPLAVGELGDLARYDRPLPGIQNYDHLLGQKVPL